MEKQTKNSLENEVTNLNPGVLVVITGRTGAGKDFVVEKFLETEFAKSLEFKMVRTNADRKRRENEPEDAYYFIDRNELDRLEQLKELAEEIVPTGSSRKATSKSEILKVIKNGQNTIWRIDTSLSVKIAKDEYFREYFPELHEVFKKQTIVICINAPKDLIEQRRKNRDGRNYNPNEYTERDEQERPHIDILLNHESVQVIENLDDEIKETIDKVSLIIKEHHDKIKNKKV